MAGFASQIDTLRTPSRRSSGRIALLLLALGLALPGTAPAESAPADTLVVVNGEALTAAEMDGLVMKSHGMFRMEEETSGLVDKILNKWINDTLIVQDALAAGMDEEPEQAAYVARQQRRHAIEAYVGDRYKGPASVPEDSLRAYFERYYWQIEMRRMSLRTREEAEKFRSDILAGADMDALAREHSLDTKKPTGGLYRMLYWADVENRIRDRVHALGAGEISEVFPYNDAFTFVRVEKRTGVDEEAYARFAGTIEAAVRESMRKQAWEAFVQDHVDRCEIAEDLAGMAAIVADSAVVIKGEFLKSQPAAVIEIADGPSASGTDLRKAISEEAMQDALQPFGVLMNKGRRKVVTELALAKAAEDAGYFDDPAVVAAVTEDQKAALIEAYLADTVASKIAFNRQELDDFYEEHKERFRGPRQYRLDILILDDEAEAKEAAQRLDEGADFAFIWREYRDGEEPTLGQSNFITAEQLSEPFRIHLGDMDPGDTSPAIEMPMGWMIFKLDAEREGEVAPIQKVEMEIRRVVYQRKFNTYLDEHLTLLKEQSDIDRREDRIKDYILSGE